MENYENVRTVAKLCDLVESVPRSQLYRVSHTLYVKAGDEHLPYVKSGSVIDSRDVIELYRAFKSDRLYYKSAYPAHKELVARRR